MKKIKIFYREESPYYPGRYRIAINHDLFHCESTTGSFNILPARLCGLMYSDYLRMCRDCFGAEIIGKGSNYPVAYFKLSKELNDLIEQLNARANLVLWEREHPDFEEHAQYVKEKNPRFYAEVNGNVYNN